MKEERTIIPAVGEFWVLSPWDENTSVVAPKRVVAWAQRWSTAEQDWMLEPMVTERFEVVPMSKSVMNDAPWMLTDGAPTQMEVDSIVQLMTRWPDRDFPNEEVIVHERLRRMVKDEA